MWGARALGERCVGGAGSPSWLLSPRLALKVASARCQQEIPPSTASCQADPLQRMSGPRQTRPRLCVALALSCRWGMLLGRCGQPSFAPRLQEVGELHADLLYSAPLGNPHAQRTDLGLQIHLRLSLGEALGDSDK